MAFKAPAPLGTSNSASNLLEAAAAAPTAASSSSTAFGGPPLLRASSSFMLMNEENSLPSDPFAAAQRLYTPQPPDVRAQRGARWGATRGIDSNSSQRMSFGGIDSDLSNAFTNERNGMPTPTAAQMRCPPPCFDVDSPALRPSRPSVEERKVPSCPQKQTSNARKPPNVAGEDMEESIHPRALNKELEETDAVLELSLDFPDMMIQSPAGPPVLHEPPPPQHAPPQAPRMHSPSLARPHPHSQPQQQPTPTRPPPPSRHPLPPQLPDVGASGDAEGGPDASMAQLREGGERRLISEAFGAVGGAQRKRHKPASGLRIVGHRLGFDDDGDGSVVPAPSSNADAAAMPPPAVLPPPQQHDLPPLVKRENSMVETKMLFTRTDRRSSSFCEKPGSHEGFNFEDHFLWQGLLGSGSFSDVYAVCLKSRPQERFAVKCSKREFKSRGERAEFLREVELANNMPIHTNVVQYYRAWQEHQVFCVQMELCAGGTLRHVMNAHGEVMRTAGNEDRVWEIILQITRGLAHIHSYQVLHCDLKPENILVSQDGAYKIGDLGLATSLTQWDEQEGDARYLSRDLLDAHPSCAADIFSFGVMIYEIATGEVLPGHGPRWDFLRSGTVPPLTSCSRHLSGLITLTMSAVPASRPDAQAIMNMTAAARVAAAQAMAAAATTAARAQAARAPPPGAAAAPAPPPAAPQPPVDPWRPRA